MKKFAILLILLVGCEVPSYYAHQVVENERKFSSKYEGKVVREIRGITENNKVTGSVTIYFHDGSYIVWQNNCSVTEGKFKNDSR